MEGESGVQTTKCKFRRFDGIKCSFTGCSLPIDEDEDAVVVATNEKLRSQLIKKLNPKDFVVSWVPCGRTVLHSKCWKLLSDDKVKDRNFRRERELVLSATETAEYYDSLPSLKKKAAHAADLIRNAKHLVAFTGAGLSTSAGIADYRGTEGVDTKQELGHKSKKNKKDEEEEEDVQYEKLMPTEAHKALVTLQNESILKYVITQNCDNLHLKSGIKRDILSELHGNVFIEYCEKCFKEYIRDYCVDLYSTNCYLEPWYVKCPTCKLNHYTGRKCKRPCSGRLRDTIVNFGDMLHDEVCGGLQRAENESKECDVMLTLGSSLCVTPAASLLKHPKHLIICNLQKTDYDSMCEVRAFAECDVFMRLVMKELKLEDAIEETTKKKQTNKRKRTTAQSTSKRKK